MYPHPWTPQYNYPFNYYGVRYDDEDDVVYPPPRPFKRDHPPKRGGHLGNSPGYHINTGGNDNTVFGRQRNGDAVVGNRYHAENANAKYGNYIAHGDANISGGTMNF